VIEHAIRKTKVPTLLGSIFASKEGLFNFIVTVQYFYSGVVVLLGYEEEKANGRQLRP
jgi:hypothetical protein